MMLYTLASAAKMCACTPNRLKSWMDRGLVPDRRIYLGKLLARVMDGRTITRLKKVIEAVDEKKMPIEAAFDRYFKEEEVRGD